MCITFLIREGERKKCFCLFQRQNLSLWSRFGFGAWPPLSVDDLRIFGLWSPGFFRNDQIWWKHLPFPPFLFLSPSRSPTQLWGLLLCAGLWHEVGAQGIFVKDGMSECMGGVWSDTCNYVTLHNTFWNLQISSWFLSDLIFPRKRMCLNCKSIDT